MSHAIRRTRLSRRAARSVLLESQRPGDLQLRGDRVIGTKIGS